MKSFFLLILILTIFNVYPQWKYSNGSNKFDGEYKSTYVVGKGEEWPYLKPQFHVNSFINEGKPNIYISNIGYTGCDYATISFAFDGIDDILVYSASSNSDNDAAFVTGSIYEISNLINLLKEQTKAYVRYENNCGTTDYEFNLYGSTKAINYVVNGFYENQIELRIKTRILKKELDSIKEIEYKKEIKQKEILDSINLIKSKIELDRKTLEFKDSLLSYFDYKGIEVSKTLLKNIIEFKINSTKRVYYCKTTFNSGNIIRNKQHSFFASDKHVIYNRIEEGCIRMGVLDESTGLQKTFFISREELSKLSEDYRIKALCDNWTKILELNSK